MSDEDDLYDDTEDADDDFELDDELGLEAEDGKKMKEEKVDPKKIASRRRLDDYLEQRRLEKELDDLW